MSIRGFARLFSGSPVHPIGTDGRMALADHFREFRARIMKSALAVVLGAVIAVVYREQVLDFLYQPYLDAQPALKEVDSALITRGPAGGLMLYIKLCGFAAFIGTAPIWIYQIWAFIMPGLHRQEKKWTAIFVAIAVPLFAVGVALGYLTLTKGLEILIGLNPDGITNLIDFDEYLSFFTRTLFMFGVAFLIPVFVVMLNLAGVVKGETLGKFRPWIIVSLFVFAAVATPSADPFSMLVMAIPMVLLFAIAEQIARFNDRRRAKRDVNAGLSPDEASVL